MRGLAGKFMYVEPVYDTAGFRKRGPYDFVHGVGQAKGDLFDRMATIIVYALEYSNDIFGFRPRDDGD